MVFVNHVKEKKTNMKKSYFIFGVLIVIALVYLLSKGVQQNHMETGTSVIHVVAAENFYGDVVKQLGGNHVQVLSILSDPNTDPHEYESSVQDSIAVAKANIVVENGLGYDTWMDKLLSASPSKNRVLLIGGKLASQPLSDNPHVWYGIDNVQTIAGDITNALKKTDPAHAMEFDRNLLAFDASLQPLRLKIADIKKNYEHTPVGLTETIYLYQTQPEGLHVLTPFAFEKAIAEGNDPAADDVAAANDQITKQQAKILIFNIQTVTPITTNLVNLAKTEHMPVVPVSETMPQDKHYQSWMGDQLTNLENALQSTK